MKQVIIYTRFNRFWHWAQAVLIVMLAVTGLDIHFNQIQWFDFEYAVAMHKTCAWAFVILIAFALFWHLTTGQWKNYIPTKKNLKEMVHFYVSGIFRGEHHPHHKTELSKLNPLQRIVYLGLNVLVIPVLVISGFLYYFYNDWSMIGLGGMSLKPVALVHTAAAYAVIAFLVAHVYLTTTGQTPWSNIIAMITGKENLPDEPEASQE